MNDADLTRESIKVALFREPDLRYEGIVEGSKKITQEQVEEMLSEQAVKEFDRAYKWLSLTSKRKTINTDVGSSYALKHDAERWLDRNRGPKEPHPYMSNGMFIAAAIDLGFKRRPVHGINCYLNISARSFPAS